jgi:hypothetical protein
VFSELAFERTEPCKVGIDGCDLLSAISVSSRPPQENAARVALRIRGGLCLKRQCLYDKIERVSSLVK